MNSHVHFAEINVLRTSMFVFLFARIRAGRYLRAWKPLTPLCGRRPRTKNEESSSVGDVVLHRFPSEGFRGDQRAKHWTTCRVVLSYTIKTQKTKCRPVNQPGGVRGTAPIPLKQKCAPQTGSVRTQGEQRHSQGKSSSRHPMTFGAQQPALIHINQ